MQLVKPHLSSWRAYIIWFCVKLFVSNHFSSNTNHVKQQEAHLLKKFLFTSLRDW